MSTQYMLEYTHTEKYLAAEFGKQKKRVSLFDNTIIPKRIALRVKTIFVHMTRFQNKSRRGLFIVPLDGLYNYW